MGYLQDKPQNISYRGDTNVGKKLHQLGTDIQVVMPSSLTDESGTLMEVDIDMLIEKLNEVVLWPIRSKFLFEYNLELLRTNNLANLSHIPHYSFSTVTWEQYILNNPSTSTDNLIFLLFEQDSITRSQYAMLYDLSQKDEALQAMQSLSARTVIESIGHQSRTPTGRFTKRFASYMFKIHNIRLTTEQITAIGNIYNDCRIIDKEFHVRVTNNFDWRDGQYGKDDSCWWGCYSHSRDTLYYYGGYGLLIYPIDSIECDHSDGYGRVWILPISDDLVITFNAYGEEGKVGAAIVAKLLEKLTGNRYYYGKREVSNRYDDDYPYINGNNGYNNSGGSKCFAIFTEGNKPKDTIQIALREQSGYFESNEETECSACGCSLDNNEIYRNDDGDAYCSDCYSDRYSHCDACNREVYSDDTRTFEDSNNEYCDSCFSHRLAFTCGECGNSYMYENNGTFLEDIQEIYCESCRDRHAEECKEHSVWNLNECEKCEKEKESE